MRTHSAMLGARAAPSPLFSWMTGRAAGVSFHAGASLAPPGRYVARFIEILVFALLLALIVIPAPARAQTITMSSVTASPATVQPGQTVVFTATMTDNQNDSNYPVEFSLVASGSSAATAQKVFYLTLKAGAPLIQTYSWTVPAAAKAGAYTMYVAVYNPAWSVKFAQKTTALTVTAASAPAVAAAPTDLEPPVVSGTAQVGKVLSSTTGTWTGATSYAYQWAGNSAKIAGATAATYTPVSTDAGHTLTSTVTATGSSGPSASATSAPTVAIVPASTVTASGSVPFVALHTYYMSPTGSDSNNGLTTATAWKTPNHAVNCGDVIIAAAGSYSPMTGNFGKVSNCPSTSGGIDGAGGIYFAVLLCGGSDLGSSGCDISGSKTSVDITTNNWAVEGWTATTGAAARSFQCDATASGTTLLSYQAYINDISYNSAQAYDTDDGGKNTNVPGNGCDYQAVIGMIAQNSNSDPICLGAIDAVGPAPLDSKPGTHIFFYNNYAIANINNPSCHASDGEGVMFDSWDVHGFTGQGVIQNNIVYDSTWAGLQIFQQTYNSSSPSIYIVNNTLYGNEVCPYADHGNTGEINFQMNGNFPWTVTAQNNIAETNRIHMTYGTEPGCAGTSTGYAYAAMLSGGTAVKLVVGGSGTQNIFSSEATACGGTACDSGNNIVTYANGKYLGTNTYENPSFKNTYDLLTNQIGVPNCTGFANTTQCMGWNANTNTLTTPSVISDLTASASGTSGKGYQLPSTTCASNSLYPTWLKGIVYLHWNGTSLTENIDMVTKPCNM